MAGEDDEEKDEDEKERNEYEELDSQIMKQILEDLTLEEEEEDVEDDELSPLDDDDDASEERDDVDDEDEDNREEEEEEIKRRTENNPRTRARTAGFPTRRASFGVRKRTNGSATRKPAPCRRPAWSFTW